jgi:hypothetical protein
MKISLVLVILLMLAGAAPAEAYSVQVLGAFLLFLAALLAWLAACLVSGYPAARAATRGEPAPATMTTMAARATSSRHPANLVTSNR